MAAISPISLRGSSCSPAPQAPWPRRERPIAMTRTVTRRTSCCRRRADSACGLRCGGTPCRANHGRCSPLAPRAGVRKAAQKNKPAPRAARIEVPAMVDLRSPKTRKSRGSGAEPLAGRHRHRRAALQDCGTLDTACSKQLEQFASRVQSLDIAFRAWSAGLSARRKLSTMRTPNRRGGDAPYGVSCALIAPRSGMLSMKN